MLGLETVKSEGVWRHRGTPISLCSSIQQASTYAAAGNPTKQIAHDGSVTFIVYDARGRETERATFPSSYQSATTRPALSAATNVISTKWHATWNLPTQVAEPNKTTANTYNAKGMLTGQSWTATTDATGAAKFTAVKTGSTYATGWGYSASSLVTTIVTKETAAGSTTAAETGRWTYTYDASGGRIAETDKVTKRTSKVLALNPSGQVLEGIDTDNIRYRFVRGPRGQVAEHHFGIATAKLVSAAGGITNAANGFLAQYTYDGGGRLKTTQRSNAAALTFTYSATGTVTAVTESLSAAPRASARAVLAALTGTAAATPAPIGGSGLFLCSRGTTILPVALGNHAYLWDAASRRCCGRDQNRNPLLNCSESGPPTDSCTFIEGSIGKEKEIVSCCQKTANDGAWIPLKNDCHDSAERCVVRSGLKYPGAPGGRGGKCPSCWLTPDTDLPPLPPAP
jgi:YD repeat-containing protein